MKPANYAPVYAAALYPQWAEIARQHGYALAVHGSLARDFDLICIPWADAPSEPQDVVDAIVTQFAAKEVGGPPSAKPHGRMAYTLSIGFGECFADLSFMPRDPQPRASAAGLMPVERIAMLWNSLPLETDAESVVAFARAVERFHGVTPGVPGIDGGQA